MTRVYQIPPLSPHFYLPKIGLEPISQLLQSHTLPLSYLGFILEIKRIELLT